MIHIELKNEQIGNTLKWPKKTKNRKKAQNDQKLKELKMLK